MTERAGKIRLYFDAPLAAGGHLSLDKAQSHYLCTVMRLGAGAVVEVFNGRDGAWLARLERADRRAAVLEVEAQSAPQRMPPDLWLGFAPVKKARTDFIVEKATELGVARILPVRTRYTQSERVRTDRLQAHAVEAAEQCGGTFVPDVAEAVTLEVFIAGLGERRLLFCDESLTAAPVAEALAGAAPGPWAILIGPEGGFAPEEAERLRALPRALPVTLGPRILRADTAAVAAVSAWQIALGDW